ncbi:DUF4181 domain-containing protein [Bacillus sp. RG28]|uniref:DUF4181 domain-containing protein n=1 Tax=Gottfriedia endophytica TaxID=2820819 RepID=A0A940NJG9_9BACI|nr:DUF4181 domain-containing protein [Gottfriedia endophytica]MBP0725277.1 DUF4181 domain-containing protein [Gottfriedia endophytica]
MEGRQILKVICIMLAMILMEAILRKIFKIKYKNFWGKYESYNKNFERMKEFAFYIFFLVVLCDFYFHSLADAYLLPYIFAALVWLLRGIDYWIYSRPGKGYVLSWLCSGTVCFILIFKYFG